MIVTDIAMPGVDGIEAVALIRRHNPNARIVFVTVHAELMLVEAGSGGRCARIHPERYRWRRARPRGSRGTRRSSVRQS